MNSSVFFVGKPQEVSHHAQTFVERLAVRIASPEEVVDLAHPGDVAVFFSEHFDRFRNSIRQLQAKDVATLYLIDGILEWRNAWENRDDEPACPFTMRPILCHKAACIGPSQKRILDSWGNAARTELVGIPRLDRLQGRQRPAAMQTIGVERETFRILVATAKVPGFTPEQITRTRSSLFDLKKWFEQTNAKGPADRKIEVVWRLTAGLDQDLQVQNQLTETTGAELVAQLNSVDALISTPSTTLLEGMALGIPVASLDYHGCPVFVPTVWTIHSRDSIPSVISELMNPIEPKMQFQLTLLQDALTLPPNQELCANSATDRLVELVGLMQGLTNKQILSKKTPFFPPNLLPAPATPPNLLDHSKVFQNFPEFENTDKLKLQVELAHSRREIDHMQRELNQLKSELSQAHEIFRQIQQHPVAGPIVRLRQKFIDWLQKNEPAKK